MLYPLGGCETQPLIDVRNITLMNVTSHSGFLPPGIIRGNATNPMDDISLIDVKITGWWKDMGWSFISEYAYGESENSYPDPHLGKESERVFELFTVPNAIEFLEGGYALAIKDHTGILGWETLGGIVVWALGMALKGL